MEFELIPRIGEDGVLRTNAAELVESVKAQLKPYNYIVDEGNYAQAKQDRAFLNKAATQIGPSRKLLEDKVFATWKTDKAQIMAIEKDIKQASEALGEGIKAIDDEEKAEKAKNLEACWNAAGGNKYRFEGILAEHKSWLNKTAKRDVIAIEMQKELHDLGLQEKQIEKEIADLEEAQQVYLMEAWYKSREYQLTLQAAHNIRTANAKAAAMAKVEEERPHVAHTEPHSEPKAFTQTETHSEQIYRRAFIVEGNESQLRALIGCMQQTGLRILSIAKKDIPNTLPFGQ
ncbi:DUF1351 domain-containing protein [Faecalibaculum rodentium]|uniref:DUF1351 domain-containing protein n=1 Tax=Faecalibaculum rodentium TaxID=1702221 RepID=UPI00261952A1|nr:DUF1351 domain-containing protein [Faecalibaculum rodentium]